MTDKLNLSLARFSGFGSDFALLGRLYFLCLKHRELVWG